MSGATGGAVILLHLLSSDSALPHLTQQSHRVPEVSLTDGADVSRLAALLAASSDSKVLRDKFKQLNDSFP